MNQRAPPPALRGEAIGEHGHDRVELRLGQIPVRIGAAKQCEQIRFRPIITGRGGDNLLGEDVQGLLWDAEPVQVASPKSVEQGGAFHQFVTAQGEDAALGGARDAVPGAPHPLQESGDGSGGAELTYQIHRADIDAQFQGSRSHQGLQVARLEPSLGVQALLAGQAAVVGCHLIVSQPFAEIVGHPFGQPARVDKDQRGVVLADQLGDALIDLVPHLQGHDGLQGRTGQFDSQVHLPQVPRIDDGAVGIACGI